MIESLSAAAGGVHLEELTGLRSDPHLLTGLIWRTLVAGHVSGGPTLFVLNLSLLVLLAGAIAAFALCSSGRGRRMAAAVAALLVLCSPFSLALIRDPVGGEALISVLLTATLAADLLGLLRLHFLVRCALVAALVLQEPSFILAALAYGLLSLACCPRRVSWLAFVTASLAVVGRLMLGQPAFDAALHPSLDPLSGSLGVLVLAIFLFGFMPAALYLSKVGLYQRLGIGGWSWPAFVLACSAFVGCIFAGTFGLAAHALAAECILLLPLATIGEIGRSVANVRSAVLLLCLALEIFTMRPIMAVLPAVVIERESAGLNEALAAASTDGSSICIAGEDVARYDLLAGGAFIKTHGRAGVGVHSSNDVHGCLAAMAPRSRLISVMDGVVHDWGRSGFAMAKALNLPARASMLPVNGGVIEPRRALHGRDVFSTMLDTPVGKQPSFTVLAGYSYRFKCLPARATQRLSFAAANPLAGLPGTTPVRLMITEKTAASATVILNRIITPKPGQPVYWEYYSLKLPAAKSCRDLIFAVSAPTGRAIGAWGTFLGAALTVAVH